MLSINRPNQDNDLFQQSNTSITNNKLIKLPQIKPNNYSNYKKNKIKFNKLQVSHSDLTNNLPNINRKALIMGKLSRNTMDDQNGQEEEKQKYNEIDQQNDIISQKSKFINKPFLAKQIYNSENKTNNIQQQIYSEIDTNHDILNNQSSLSLVNPHQTEQNSQFKQNQYQQINTIENNPIQQQFNPILRKQTQQQLFNNRIQEEFEEKIRQNKAIIKKEVKKKKKQNGDKINKLGSYSKGKNGSKGGRHKNESLYEKRVREYKEYSENKYLKNVKNELVVIREKKQRQQLRKSKELQNKKIINLKQDKKKIVPIYKKKQTVINRYTPNIINSPKNKKQINIIHKTKAVIKQKTDNQQQNIFSNPNQNLYQDIQNILQHPHKSRSQFLQYKKIMKDKNVIRQRMQQLEQKHRELEQREKKQLRNMIQQGYRQVRTSTTCLSEQGKNNGYNILDWNRICIKNKEIENIDSNFENELQKINRYLNNNEKALQRYLNSQQLLLEIEFQKRLEQEKYRNKLGRFIPQTKII